MSCNHTAEGTLVVATDGCSLECTECKEIIVAVECVAFTVEADDIVWVE